MIISITGASGFIGKKLVTKCLAAGYEVRILSRKTSINLNGVSVFNADLLNEDVQFKDFVKGADVLINCAGDFNNTNLMYDLHVRATERLLDESIKQGVGRWIQLSSVGAYGPSRNGLITEKSQENPFGIYEKTKTEADIIVKKSGIPYTIVRPSNVFGSSMKNESLFQLNKILEKKLFFYIVRNSLVNYVHVGDVVNSLLLCASSDVAIGKTYIISQSLKIEKMIESLLIGLRIKRNFFYLPEWLVRSIHKVLLKHISKNLTESRIDALTSKCIYNSRKIEKELNFQFEKTLEERFISFAKKR